MTNRSYRRYALAAGALLLLLVVGAVQSFPVNALIMQRFLPYSKGARGAIELAGFGNRAASWRIYSAGSQEQSAQQSHSKRVNSRHLLVADRSNDYLESLDTPFNSDGGAGASATNEPEIQSAAADIRYGNGAQAARGTNQFPPPFLSGLGGVGAPEENCFECVTYPSQQDVANIVESPDPISSDSGSPYFDMPFTNCDECGFGGPGGGSSPSGPQTSHTGESGSQDVPEVPSFLLMLSGLVLLARARSPGFGGDHSKFVLARLCPATVAPYLAYSHSQWRQGLC